jgi:opacity protein-like surface antigen
MVKQKLVLFFLLIAVAYLSKAQTAIGLEGGVSSSYLNTNISNRASSIINYGAGYTFDLSYQYKIKHWLYIETAPGITQKNYFIDRTDSFAGIYEEFKNTYLQIPVMAKFLYGHHSFQAFADAGLYGGYWLSATVKGVIPNILSISQDAQGNGTIQQTSYNEKYQINPETDNRLEFGWVAGAGVQYHFNHDYMLTASARYYQALTNQQKDYEVNQIPQYNQTFTFLIGFMKTFR